VHDKWSCFPNERTDSELPESLTSCTNLCSFVTNLHTASLWSSLAVHKLHLLDLEETWRSLVCVVDTFFLLCESKSTLHALPKDEELYWYGQANAIVTIHTTVYTSAEEASEKFRYCMVKDISFSTCDLSCSPFTTDWVLWKERFRETESFIKLF